MRTKKKYPIFLLSVICSLLTATFSACSESDDNSLESNPVEIVVSTGFGSASGVETRGIGSIHTNSILTNGPLPLSVVRIDQSGESDGSYLSYTPSNTDGIGQVPRSGRLEKFNLDIRMNFDTDEYYLSRAQNNKTKLIAWYPSVHEGGSVWHVDGSTATVEFTVDGDTDIMMSNLVEGSKDNPFSGADNRMTFKHLLTRFIVRVYTYDSEVQNMFGGITSISFANKSQTCIAQLPSVNASGNTDAETTFEGEDNLLIIRKKAADNTNISEYDENGMLNVPLLATSADNDETIGLAGYAMVAPVEDKVTLIVDTEERKNLNVFIDAPKGGFVAGKSYILALEFKDKGLEFVNVIVQDWELDETIEKEIN